MKDKFPGIYKAKIGKLKTKVQNDYYYHANSVNTNERSFKRNDEPVDKLTLTKKISSIFTRPDYVYQADVIIMYKNGESKQKKIIGKRDNYLITMDNEKIMIDDILDIK